MSRMSKKGNEVNYAKWLTIPA
uniref:Uncharacterized protein n=1 Tax=Arundo donax TaxID=35708 RepID=A0A0A9HMK7_ARUDO